MGSLEIFQLGFVMFSLLLLLLPATTFAWCTTAGGVGDHSTHCSDAVDFEACFATRQCYDAMDNPTHMHDALCILDECFCVFDACPYGRLLTSPICCTKSHGGPNDITCRNYCDNYPEDC